ncbi:F-box protein [Raphanus sativus]|nr:F-box protein [Raphanus sativus]
MQEFPILSLPAEVQALVVERVTDNSFEDFYRHGATCKSMCALADYRGVYASFDLFKYHLYVGSRNLLLRRCYAEGNPSTLYIKGVEYFYRLDRNEDGLALLKTVAGAGYERTLYTYAMTTKFFSEDGEYISRFTRESFLRHEWLLDPHTGDGIGIIMLCS